MKVTYSLIFAVLLGVGMASAAANERLFVDDQTVRQAQKILNDRGYKTGGIDGKMGAQTQAALVNFQRAEKLKPSGRLDRETLAALGIQKADGTPAAGSYDAATIRKAQETLNDRGFQAGPANGVMGERTAAAIGAFQKSEGLTITGRLNPRTLAALGIDRPSAAAGATRGSSNASANTIRDVQRKLAERGYRPGTADGVLGRATRSALMSFQRAEKLPVTGHADRQTLAALGIKS